MKVLVDLTQIRIAKAGVGVYAHQLLENLLAQDRETEYVTLVQDDDPTLDFSVFENMQTIRVSSKLFRRIPLRLLMEQIYIPYLVRKHRIDVVHSLHYTFPLISAGAKRVVTIHDLTSFICPEYLVPIKRFAFRFFIRSSAKWVDRLIFDSKSTERDFADRFAVEAHKCSVVHLGTALNPERVVDPVRISALGVHNPYALFIGTLEPRKNITGLLRAFALLREKGLNLSLVVAGNKGWYYEEIFRTHQELALGDSVKFTGFIDDATKTLLLSNAAMLVYPSLYEGFGIPVLEAMSFGIPTITSNISSMPEIAGDGALLVDPYDVSAIADSMERILCEPGLADTLRSKALARASAFSWHNTAKNTLAVYRSAFGSSGH